MNITYSFELPELNKIANLLAIPARAYEAEVEIEAVTYGKYLPATWDFPAEYPELEITSFTNLIIYFWEESTDTYFAYNTELSQLIDLIEDRGLLDPHYDDIETHFWDIYHKGDRDEI